MNQGLKYLLIGFLVSLPLWWTVNIFQNNLENVFYANISQPLENMFFVEMPAKNERPKLDLEVKSALSLKINKFGRKKVFFRKKTEDVLPIASLTKLMTALIVIEDPENYTFSKTVIISQRATNQENVPIYGNLEKGDSFTTENLLSLMLVYSSNDAAWALSEVIGNNNFVEKMNQKAQDLGLNNTYFVNPTGLEPQDLNYNSIIINHVNRSTAQDLLSLAQYILENHPLILSISLEQGPYAIQNGFSSLSLPNNVKVLGGKTGYTNEAGGCILLVLIDQKESIFVDILLAAPSPQQRIVELQKLINWQYQ